MCTWAKTELPVGDFAEALSLDGKTGVLTWTKGQRAGRVAGFRNRRGYRHILFKGATFQAHRIVWALAHGTPVPEIIDHINGDGDDNRPANLRAATLSLNGANAKKRSGRSSQLKGVTWHAGCRKWQASIKVGGKCHYLGLFQEEAAAHEAYVAAATMYFGQFARAA